jgi:hypothetical protein
VEELVMKLRSIAAGFLFVAACGAPGTPAAHSGPATVRTTTTKPAVVLPYEPLAIAAACPADALTIKIAEQAYSLLNTSFATMPELVTAGFLPKASTYYPTVKLGSPPGGYTLIGGPKCNNIPVAG